MDKILNKKVRRAITMIYVWSSKDIVDKRWLFFFCLWKVPRFTLPHIKAKIDFFFAIALMTDQRQKKLTFKFWMKYQNNQIINQVYLGCAMRQHANVFSFQYNWRRAQILRQHEL